MAREALNLNDIYALSPGERVWGERIVVYADTVARNGAYELVYGANSTQKSDNRNWIKVTDSVRAVANADSVAVQTDINVENGTLFEAIPLPTTVAVTLDTGAVVLVPVTWIIGDYDKDVDDTYTIAGSLNLSTHAFIADPDELTPHVDVIVTTPEEP